MSPRAGKQKDELTPPIPGLLEQLGQSAQSAADADDRSPAPTAPDTEEGSPGPLLEVHPVAPKGNASDTEVQVQMHELQVLVRIRRSGAEQ